MTTLTRDEFDLEVEVEVEVEVESAVADPTEWYEIVHDQIVKIHPLGAREITIASHLTRHRVNFTRRGNSGSSRAKPSSSSSVPLGCGGNLTSLSSPRIVGRSTDSPTDPPGT